ncbi:MAG: 3-oxoacyl-ACP reductase [Aeromicrobium sp.]|jgi:NAD(P)-dependent dehydrogenase (short-subunit alcohol dehydrogenase family)|uniref:SDR family oxidoreductase n=1 Tax=Aeromicrobium sp. TaxID=1871063 RepID=UPI00263106CE|nr:SDR family oxidoreductase [Aeromicrobium sp.]MCW2789157.1 3-oxoacyl-ACP reductase [Aeromicrobium sp.]MCW2825954.1 3-oxoacyl-ACP reductase [Aeromicrobium sp.]
MGRFDGKVAIVTGASRGIGLAIAERIVADGGRVCITARKPGPLTEAVEALGGPERAIFVAGAADDAAHQDEVVAATLDAFGSIDFLVNNTGINPVYGRMIDVDLDAANKIFQVNVVAAIAWAQKVYRAWMAEHGGSIVSIASVAGQLPAPGIGTYGASKAALIHVTEELAVELGPGIRVNAVAPAVVKTKFAAALYEGREEEVAAPYPLKRLGKPDDIGSVVAFLLSEDAGWVTGQTISIDGGLLLTGGV